LVGKIKGQWSFFEKKRLEKERPSGNSPRRRERTEDPPCEKERGGKTLIGANTGGKEKNAASPASFRLNIWKRKKSFSEREGVPTSRSLTLRIAAGGAEEDTNGDHILSE